MYKRYADLMPGVPLQTVWDDTGDALTEISRFFKRTGKSIIPLTVKEILDEEIAQRLA
jgi:hypothetical protein